MTDISIDVKAACAAARRYAQLVFYHDNSPQSQYRTHPFWAWRDFLRQFSVVPRGVAITSLISHSYLTEWRSLTDARRDGGPLPPVANGASLRDGIPGVHEGRGEKNDLSIRGALSVHVME